MLPSGSREECGLLEDSSSSTSNRGGERRDAGPSAALVRWSSIPTVPIDRLRISHAFQSRDYTIHNRKSFRVVTTSNGGGKQPFCVDQVYRVYETERGRYVPELPSPWSTGNCSVIMRLHHVVGFLPRLLSRRSHRLETLTNGTGTRAGISTQRDVQYDRN